VYDVIFSREGNFIAYSGQSTIINLIEISDLKKRGIISKLKGHSSSVSKLTFSINTLYLISGCFGKTIKIWNV